MPKEKYKTTHAKKILQLLEAPPDQDKFKKESLKKYTTGSKGRAEDFNEDKIAIKQFCEVQATTAFCIRRGVGRYKYVGNTPRKPPRDLDFSGKNLANRGKSMGTYPKKDLSREKLLGMMAGGEELDKLEVELKEMDRISKSNN